LATSWQNAEIMQEPPMETTAATRYHPYQNTRSPWESTAAIMAGASTPMRRVGPFYVGEGLFILAGRHKPGKTCLALDRAIAVASGGMAMVSDACKQGDVLCGDFENGETGETAPAMRTSVTLLEKTNEINDIQKH
jgi:hypothetical protein